MTFSIRSLLAKFKIKGRKPVRKSPRAKPKAVHELSRRYLEASVHHNVPSSDDIIAWFLLCHSIELGLKAFLLSKDVQYHVLRQKLRHNLTNLHKRAVKEGLKHHFKESDLLGRLIKQYDLTRLYGGKEFEYVEGEGVKQLPPFDVMAGLTEAMLYETSSACDVVKFEYSEYFTCWAKELQASRKAKEEAGEA